MNLHWKDVYVKERDSGTLCGVFETECYGIPVLLRILVTPSSAEFDSKRCIFARVFIKGEKISDAYFHLISDDIYPLAKQHIQHGSCYLSKLSFCEYYYVNRFSRQMPFTFGDYTFVE